MKKLFITFCVLIITLLCGISTFAADTDDSGKWEYQTYGTGVELTSYKGTQTDVYVPSKTEVNGEFLPVIKLGDNLFKGNTSLNSVTISEGITEIGASAFEGATNLVCIVTPESLTTIGARAFSGCTAFNSVILYDSVTSIGKDSFVGCDKLTIYCNKGTEGYNYAVVNSIKCEVLNSETVPQIIKIDGLEYYIMNGEAIVVSYDNSKTSVTIPVTVEGYPVTSLKNVFSNCTSLTDITLPDSLNKIADSAFSGCTSLTSIIIPDSVSSIGNKAFSKCTSLKNVVLPEKMVRISTSMFEQCSRLVSITIPDGVTSIGDYAFSRCTSLTSITLPDTITSGGLGYQIFYGCSNLKNIKIPDSVERLVDNMFENCVSLTDIEIPDSVTYIGNSVFKGCTNLTSITIPDSVTGMGISVFSDCIRLTDITFSKKMRAIGSSSFYGCRGLKNITIPENITRIGSDAFYYCSGLTDITIPNSVTAIGYRAFYGCVSLTDITLPDSLEIIDEMTFYNCTSLANVIMPEGVTSIGYEAFSGCSVLTNVIIPDSVTTINNYAFYGCKKITTVIIPENVTKIYTTSFEKDAFWFVYENSYACNYAEENDILHFVTDGDKTPEIYTVGGITYYIKSGEAVALSFDGSLSEVVIPETIEGYPVTELRSTFKNCTALVDVTLPKSLKKILNYAFYGCSGLTDITIPNGVTNLGYAVFSKCSNLTDVTIPDSVTVIGEYAFSNCEKITAVIIPESVTKIDTTSFEIKTFWFVYENSYAHTFATEKYKSCFVINKNEVPEIYTVEGITYYIKDGEAVAFAFDNSLSVVTIPDAVEDYPVTELIRTFYNSSVKSVHLPQGLKVIGKEAFNGCSSLTSITIPDNVESIGSCAFHKCSNLQNVTIGNRVTSIGSSAFWYCQKLANITIGNSVIDIGDSAFYNCNGLTGITIPDCVERIGSSAFYGCSGLKSITIPNSVMSIGSFAFYNCKGLTGITIPDGVECIASCMFYGCSALKNITIPDSVTSIGSQAFESCVSLTDIIIPGSVTDIGYRAFYSSSITDVTIPNSVTSIGQRAFSYCKNLTNVKLPNELKIIEEGLFYGCNNLSDVTIPDSVTSIGSSAFYACTGLKNIAIPKRVTCIWDQAFCGCSNLTSITIPDGVTDIRDGAFSSSSKVKFVLIPSSVRYMYSNSFYRNTILLVYENSGAHTFAQKNDMLYFVLHKTDNPEISYGTGITGTVKYTDGSATSGTTVEILYDDGTLKESITTDANGNYEFTYAEVGRYTIRVTDDDGNTASEIVSVKRMNVFDVYLAGETDLVLKKGYNVSGTVSPDDAKITISDTKGNIIKSVDVTDGVFTFADIPRGSYIVKAENETGSASTEIYVSNEDITGISLEIQTQSATITGDTKIENRDGTFTAKIWVSVDLIDAEGNIIAIAKTDADGRYTFEKIPAGIYNIVAKASEMRPAYGANFDKSFELTGYGYIEIIEAKEYNVSTIILREEKINLTEISGKITANGSTQDCQVILTNESGDQIAVFITDKNGKYSFINIPDGMYSITAITKADGMGYTVITIDGGVVFGSTDIKVAKSDKISKREETLLSIPDCNTKSEALIYKEAIMAEKEFYDSLSEKERKELSEGWIEKLFKLVGLISDSNVSTSEGVTVENIESAIAFDEIEETINFTLTVSKANVSEAGENGITREEEYETEKMKDKKGKNQKIAQYYDITLSKDGQTISNIQKQTETNGKLLITMEIPEEYRGHKEYSFIHMHNGEAVTLVDLDDDPNTVTFEIDKFSTFALTYSDVELVGQVEQTTYPASITYNENTGKISVFSTETAKLYIATYNGKQLSGIVIYDVIANATAIDYDFSSNQAAFVWNENQMPLCEKFTLGE